MASTNLYNQQGKVIGTIELPDAVFAVPVKAGLVHRVLVALQANGRQTLAHTKGRGEVRGGGRKPWRQKGTGRARQGSIRSPQWIGGGIVFGPHKDRSFVVKINRAVRRQALLMTLSDKASQQGIVVVDTLDMPTAKTKEVATLLRTLPGVGSRALIVALPSNEGMYRGARNLPKAKVIDPRSVNVRAIMEAQTLVIGKDELEALTQHFSRA